MQTTINGVTYSLYEQFEDCMTRRANRIYAILDDIFSDEMIEKLKGNSQEEMSNALVKIMTTHQKCRIIANMIDCPSSISENAIFDELQDKPKKETDELICFFFERFMPVVIAERATILMTFSNALKGNTAHKSE